MGSIYKLFVQYQWDTLYIFIDVEMNENYAAREFVEVVSDLIPLIVSSL
jgi:hypothetical protein